MKNSKLRLAGWVLSGLISAFLIVVSASGKFVDWEGKAEMMDHFGYSTELMFKIGMVEVILALLFLVPKAGFLAAILLTGYLGGALGTHLRVGDPFYFPILVGILIWIALGLRQPAIFALAVGSGPSDPA